MNDLMLRPGPRTDGNPKDPYTKEGAKRVLRLHIKAAADTLMELDKRGAVSPALARYINTTPLGRNYILAAAMQTSGLIAETPSTVGQCLLYLTPMGLRQVDSIRRKGVV